MDSLTLRDYGASHGSHSHTHFQALVGVSGVLELEVEGRGSRIGAGDALLVAPGDRHDFESKGGSRCLVLDSAFEPWSLCGPAPARPRQLNALAAYLAEAVAACQPLALQSGPALLLEAWKPDTACLRPRRAIDWAALSAWAQARLHLPLSVADLAAQALLSPSQFALRCQEAQGMGPMQWLRAQRLARARLLRAGGMAVSRVAERTGYRSPSALTAALKKAGF